jgi:retron-type reverse transcriptase
VILPREEAERLFSDTLRTRNRHLRDLATDEEQLIRYGLPVWKSEAEIAAALELPLKQLQHYSFHRQRETSPHYVVFAVPKRSGGQRLIYAPKRRLKALQRRLNELLVDRLPVSQQAHGFRPQRSVATNASPHAGKAVVIKLDLKDCFPSIRYARVRGLLIALGYGYPVAASLAVLMTEAPRQPVEAEGKLYHVPVGPRACVQGAPTSPGLCNAVLMRLDRRLAGLAQKHGFAYTRYADDLTFSGHDPAKIKLLISLSGRIVREEGFQLNRRKTRVLRRSQRQRVTGVVVNQQPGLSRQERRRLRAAVHQLVQSGGSDSARRQYLVGKLAYLHMLNPAQAAPLIAKLRSA